MVFLSENGMLKIDVMTAWLSHLRFQINCWYGNQCNIPHKKNTYKIKGPQIANNSIFFCWPFCTLSMSLLHIFLLPTPENLVCSMLCRNKSVTKLAVLQKTNVLHSNNRPILIMSLIIDICSQSGHILLIKNNHFAQYIIIIYLLFLLPSLI